MHDDINLKACPQICLIWSNKEAGGEIQGVYHADIVLALSVVYEYTCVHLSVRL